LEISPIEFEIRIRYTARFVPPMPQLVKMTLRKKRTVPNGAKVRAFFEMVLRPEGARQDLARRFNPGNRPNETVRPDVSIGRV
jgi:hypothetical protein